MSKDVLDTLQATGGAYISLVQLVETELPRTALDIIMRRPGRKEFSEKEIRARKWSKIDTIEDGWLLFKPVEFEVEPGRYSAVTARRYPHDTEPLARMTMRQPIPAAGKVRITPKILLTDPDDETTVGELTVGT